MTTIVDYSTTMAAWMSPVMYQGDQGSCGPCMVVNAVGMMSNLYGDHFSVNPQILYNMSLKSENALGHDIGVYPPKFMELLKTAGVTESTDLDYGLTNIGVMPSVADYTDAKTHTITGYTKIDLATQENTLSHVIAQYLLQGKAVLQAFNATYNFMGQSGPLSSQAGDDTGTIAGGHFVQVVGVDTHTNMLTVASWGTQYGDNGLFHMSLDSFYNDKGGNQFNLDKLYVVNGFDGHDLTQNATTKLVASAYVGIFDRAPELEGMTYWGNNVKNGMALSTLCNNLLSSAEYKSSHVNETNAGFVESIFHNVLNRDVDAGGLAYYTNALNNGANKGDIATGIITNVIQQGNWAYDLWLGDGTFAGHPKSNDPDMFTESLLFNNKLIAAQDYAITLQADSLHTNVAHAIIANVTTDPGSIWGVALIGVSDQLGRSHVDGITTH